MRTETSIYEYAKQGLAISPNEPALWFYGKAISYRELFCRIDNVADHLYALGVREGTVVTIHLPNCPQAVMTIYAVAKLGGICNMVHAQMPRQALINNMAFTESRILITYLMDCVVGERTLIVDLAFHMGLPSRLIYRIKTNKGIMENALSFEQRENESDTKATLQEQKSLGKRCAVYMHSSGTMGMPKIVMLSHQAINNWVQDIFEGAFCRSNLSNHRALEVLPLFHGTGFAADMHLMLSGGAQIIQLAKWNTNLAIRSIHKYGITYISAVPKMYSRLLESRRFKGKWIASLWRCGIGGDIVTTELKQRIDACFTEGRHAQEAYGMTETVSTCFLTWEQHDRIDASGYPISNQCQAAVRLGNGQISRVGEGEMLIASNTLMMGYLKDDEATKEAFVNWNGRQWFCTGDYGKISDDGYIYFLERIKKIIVRNGYNIYPHEVEAVMLRHPAVSEAFVVGEFDRLENTEKIVAYLVIKNKTRIKKIDTELRSFCTEYLPLYSVPNKIVVVENLPKNAMGKIDYQSLKKDHDRMHEKREQNMGN